MKRNSEVKLGSPKLNRRPISPVQYINSPLFKCKKEKGFNNQMTYISKKALKKTSSMHMDFKIQDFQSIRQTRTCKDIEVNQPSSKTCIRSDSFPITEQQSTENTWSKLTENDFDLELESLSLHSLEDEEGRIQQCQRTIEQQKRRLEEQTELLRLQEKQLREMRLREKKMREQLEKARIAVAMGNRKQDQQQKQINRLRRQLKKRDGNCSLQLSIDSFCDGLE